MFDGLLGRVRIFGQAVCISRGTCGISTHAISYQVKAAMFVFAHVENHTGVAVALAASLRGWNLVRNCQVCASAATSVSWPARMFFLASARISVECEGALFQHFGDQFWTPAGAEKGNQNGSPNWARQKGKHVIREQIGGPFWVPQVWRPRTQSHSMQGETGGQPFCKREPQAGVRAVSGSFHGCFMGGRVVQGVSTTWARWSAAQFGRFFGRFSHCGSAATLRWPVLASPGLSWPLLASPGLSWLHFVFPGLSRLLLAFPGFSWPLPALPVFSWPRFSWSLLASPGRSWPLLASPGFSPGLSWHFLASPGFSWLLMASPGFFWLSWSVPVSPGISWHLLVSLSLSWFFLAPPGFP